MRWLRQHRPDLVPQYRELYGDRAYAPKAYQKDVGARVARLARKHHVGDTTGARARRIREGQPPPRPEQLSLA